MIDDLMKLATFDAVLGKANRMEDENTKLREALEIIAGHRQPADNLMSNQDIARAALK